MVCCAYFAYDRSTTICSVVRPAHEHELIEAVGLDLAGQQLVEGFEEFVATCVVDLDTGGQPHADVEQVEVLVADDELVRVLFQRFQTEMTEQRQQTRQRHRARSPVQAHPPLVGWRVERLRQRRQ